MTNTAQPLVNPGIQADIWARVIAGGATDVNDAVNQAKVIQEQRKEQFRLDNRGDKQADQQESRRAEHDVLHEIFDANAITIVGGHQYRMGDIQKALVSARGQFTDNPHLGTIAVAMGIATDDHNNLTASKNDAVEALKTVKDPTAIADIKEKMDKGDVHGVADKITEELAKSKPDYIAAKGQGHGASLEERNAWFKEKLKGSLHDVNTLMHEHPSIARDPLSNNSGQPYTAKNVGYYKMRLFAGVPETEQPNTDAGLKESLMAKVTPAQAAKKMYHSLGA